MIRRLLAFILAIALCSPAKAAGWLPLVQTSVGGGGCSQATAFIARETSHVNDTIYTTMICGMVTDGVWAKLDLLYFFAAPNSTDALLNMVGATTTSLSATAPTFTANTGFTGNGTSAQINATGYTISSGHCVQNSCALFAWNNTPGAADNGVLIGNSSSFNTTMYLSSLSFGSDLTGTVSGGTGITSSTLASGTGLITMSRTSASQTDLYQNTTNIGTNAADTSAAIGTNTATFLGIPGGIWTAGTEGAAGFAGGLTSTDVTNLQGRLHTALHAINPTTFP